MMKRTLITFGVMFAVLILASAARGDLQLQEAILYPSSATLVWKGHVSSVNSSSFPLCYLPESAVKESLRVSAEGSLRLLDVQILETKEDRRKEAMEEEMQRLEVRKRVLEAKRDFLKGLFDSREKGGWWEKVSMQEAFRRLQSLEKNLTAVFSDLGRVERTLKKKREFLERWKQTHKWGVYVKFKGVGVGDVKLSYKVKRAGWAPFYTARLAHGKIAFRFMARVHQDTGVDWPKVRVLLSTAQPGRGVEPPEPRPLYLRPQEPLRKGLRTMAPAVMGKAFMKEGVADKAAYVPLESVAMYRLPGVVSVDSEREAVLEIQKWGISPRLERFCYAVGDPAVYLVAKIEGFSQVLPPGKIQLYQGESLVGESFFTTLPPWRFSFGRDQRFKVRRKLVKRFLDEKFGNKVEITLAYKTTVFNTGKNSKMVKVVERIPISQDERIKVGFKGATPQVQPDEKGFLKWNVTVPAQSKAEVGYSFSVKYPRDLRLNHFF